MSSSTLVHVIKKGGGGQPFCGSRVGPEQRFQFCSAGINFWFVECKRCHHKIAKVRDALETLITEAGEL